MTIYPIVLSFLDIQLADGRQVGVSSQHKPSSRQWLLVLPPPGFATFPCKLHCRCSWLQCRPLLVLQDICNQEKQPCVFSRYTPQIQKRCNAWALCLVPSLSFLWWDTYEGREERIPLRVTSSGFISFLASVILRKSFFAYSWIPWVTWASQWAVL